MNPGAVQNFLLQYGQSGNTLDVEQLVSAFLEEMNAGLTGKPSSLEMIPSYLTPEITIVPHQKIVVIDAGGTHFRSGVAEFDTTGKLILSGIRKTWMPGTIKPLSKREFYDEIAGNIRHLFSDKEPIGFCFSYGVQMSPDRDGRIISWAKEVNSLETIGTKVGECTLEALKRYDQKSHKVIVLNDTVATLLGGLSSIGKKTYSAYIGYIYGTGTNLCYIEQNSNLLKVPNLPTEGKMIINTECGNFDRLPQGTWDLMVDQASLNPGKARAEKMSSGKYLSSVIYFGLRQAFQDHLFSKSLEKFPETHFPLSAVDNFIEGKSPGIDMLSKTFLTPDDKETAASIITALIDRAAKIGASMVAGSVRKSVQGKKPKDPIAVFAEGTTFYKLFSYKERFEHYLNLALSPYGIPFEIIAGVDWNLAGAAMAGML